MRRVVLFSLVALSIGTFGQAVAKECERAPSPYQAHPEFDLRPCDQFASKSAYADQEPFFGTFADDRFTQESLRSRFDEQRFAVQIGRAQLIMRNQTYHPTNGLKIRNEGMYATYVLDDRTDILFGSWLTKYSLAFFPSNEKVQMWGVRINVKIPEK
jgi:hypothetical protein